MQLHFGLQLENFGKYCPKISQFYGRECENYINAIGSYCSNHLAIYPTWAQRASNVNI